MITSATSLREGMEYISVIINFSMIERNPRARSAMLRGCEKLETQG